MKSDTKFCLLLLLGAFVFEAIVGVIIWLILEYFGAYIAVAVIFPIGFITWLAMALKG